MQKQDMNEEPFLIRDYGHSIYILLLGWQKVQVAILQLL